jgi:hypothetical protein
MSRKPAVVLLGFYGRGNAGDEAFLHVQYELLKDKYHIILPIEHRNAVPDFHTWYPYHDCEIINYDDVPRVYGSDVVALHIGGGSLPFGFSGQFLLSAFDARKRTLITGVDASVKPNVSRDNIRFDIYKRLDFFSVRTVRSVTNLRQSGVLVHHGADWALGLQAVEPPPERRGGALVTVRDFGQPGQEHIDAVAQLHEYLERQGHQVRYLPFAPDDRRVLDQFPTANAANIENCWHDPRQVKGHIKSADVVVSVGRLHTLIMSMTAEVATVAIDPKIMVNGRHITNRKNLFFCEEVGLPFFHSVGEMIAAYGDTFNQRLAAKNFAPDYYERYRSQTELVLASIAGERGNDWRQTALEGLSSTNPGTDPTTEASAGTPGPLRGAKADAKGMTPERLARREAKRAQKLALRDAQKAQAT